MVVIPFAYVCSQALMSFDPLWFFASLWTWDYYVKERANGLFTS